MLQEELTLASNSFSSASASLVEAELNEFDKVKFQFELNLKCNLVILVTSQDSRVTQLYLKFEVNFDDFIFHFGFFFSLKMLLRFSDNLYF